MARQQLTFEWLIVEDDKWWNNPPAGDEPSRLGSRFLIDANNWLLVRLMRGLGLFLVGLVAVNGVALTPHELERIRAVVGIQEALVLEEQAWKSDDRELFDRLTDSRVSAQWQSEWSDLWAVDHTDGDVLGANVLRVEPIGDVVLVETLVTRKSHDQRQYSPYQEARFYRQGEHGWLRTAPGPEFWGSQLTLETPHFRYEFSARDAKTVELAAQRMEDVYANLYQMLELELPSDGEKLVFALTPNPVRGFGSYGDRHELTSPIVSRVPAGLSTDVYLSHRIASRLTSLAVNGIQVAESAGTYTYRWSMLLRALRGWLRTDLLGQRWPWDQEAETVLRQRSMGQLPLSLADISDASESLPNDREGYMWRYAASESVIAYVADAYGRDRLPGLLRGLRSYSSWSELIPTVFDESVEDFEMGWNRYLEEEYGL